jgi:homoserine kinase
VRVHVQVPASSANLGAGFDCFGLALRLFNEVEVRPATETRISIVGEGERRYPRDARNLVYRSLQATLEHLGRPAQPVAIQQRNAIPTTGGLGSSAAAVVAGVLAANALCGNPLDRQAVLDLATQIEGHPDNVAPALVGGLTVAVSDGSRVIVAPVAVPSALRAALFLPDFTMSTQAARRVLPEVVPRADAVFNLQRSALLVASMVAGRLDWLGVAMDDRLHQPYRQELFPAMPRFIAAAREAGAAGACLSGAGAALLVLFEGSELPILNALMRVAAQTNVSGRAMVVEICPHGASVIVSD